MLKFFILKYYIETNIFGNINYILYLCTCKKRNNMFIDGFFSLEAKYKTEIELYKSVLKCYNLICSKGMTEREIDFLSMYLKYGYNRETRKIIRESYDVNSNYIGVLNHTLKTKGFLIKDERNENKKHLSEDLIRIKEFVEGGSDVKILPISFSYAK